MKEIITTDKLTLFYGKQRGVLEVDLHVMEGEVFGFLGPNGAGKTTTLRILLDLIRPNRGTAHIFGRDCQKEGVSIRQRIGYVPGELAFPSNARGNEYLDTLNNIRQQKANPAYRRSLCERLQLDVNRTIRQYSRGNKQKLALVAAMMHQPELLLLDEPTSGLDPLMQQVVTETIREAKAEGRTVFVSSHILPEVQAVCDRVAIIREGMLIKVETVHELLERHFFRLRLRLARPIPPNFAVEGVTIIDSAETAPYRYFFEVRQNLDQFMQTIAPYGIADIETEHPSLEDVFLTYYEGGKNHVTTHTR